MFRPILFSLLLFCVPQIDAKTECRGPLPERVKSFYGYFSDVEYKKMWEMLSKRLKKANDNDSREYGRAVQKYRFKKGTEIIKVEVRGKQASVSLRISILSDSNAIVASEEHEEAWVLENGCWRYDGITRTTKTTIPTEADP